MVWKEGASLSTWRQAVKKCSECQGEYQDTVTKCPKDDSALESEHVNPLIGSCLADRYQIISMIGSGGTGVVYKAQHLKMDKPVAIKMMHSHMMAKPETLKSFFEEAKTVAQLKHHNIVTLYDFGIGTTNQPFLVMDYIDGPSLKKYIETEGPLSLDEMRPILAQITDGLAYAHSEGIVHQDLKPENIILTNVGLSVDKVTVVDFGLATLSSTEKELALSGNKRKKFIGSPYYMSPEQCLSNGVIDCRSDIYSLAIVIYEALSNKLPFEKKSAIGMMDSHVRETPTPFRDSNTELFGLNTCTELTKVFNQAMAKNPDERYQEVSVFGTELDDALARDSVKLRAIRHRSLAAEQVLVHANQANQSEQVLNKAQGEATHLRMESAAKFLSRQADFEETYLNDQVKSAPQALQGVQKENFIVCFLKRLAGISGNYKAIVTSAGRQDSECPYCKSPLKSGIQFCLNCQRKLAPAIRTGKLSETITGNYFGNASQDSITPDQQLEAKTKLQNLRQQKLITLARMQQYLNYALILALIVCSIILTQRFLGTSPSNKGVSSSPINNKNTNNRFATNTNPMTKSYLKAH